MELFAKIAHERHAGVLVVTHDHRTLDIFDRILDVEDGMIQVRDKPSTLTVNIREAIPIKERL